MFLTISEAHRESVTQSHTGASSHTQERLVAQDRFVSKHGSFSSAPTIAHSVFYQESKILIFLSCGERPLYAVELTAHSALGGVIEFLRLYQWKLMTFLLGWSELAAAQILDLDADD